MIACLNDWATAAGPKYSSLLNYRNKTFKITQPCIIICRDHRDCSIEISEELKS
jgi:hypothetical protein